jgi:hypothetical protein
VLKLGPLAHFRGALIAALVAGVGLKAGDSLAQTEGADDEVVGEVVRTPELVVVAPTVDEMVRAFVGEVSTAGQQNQLARWDRTICPGVAGMRRQYAQALIDRFAMIAFSLDLNIGEPGCRPNALIFLTEDSDALAQEIVQSHGAAVSRYGADGNTRGRAALRDFASTSRPVRWWHVTGSYTGDGFAVRQGESVNVRSMGRLRRGTREDFDRVIVIVDAGHIEGIRFGAVADYVAMAVLAQLDPAADTSAFPTILNLFADPASRPARITEWDLNYLDGLYRAPRDARNARVQERQIARRMRERLAQEGAEPQP